MKTHPLSDIRQLAVRDFASWGVQDVAYVKRITVNNQEGWAIHSADGNHVGFAPNRELAFAAVRQHELEPYSVH